MKTMRDLLATLAFVAAACFSTSALAAIPVIHHALLDATTSTVTLDGENFGATAGKVWLAKTQLTVQAWNDTKIIATVPTGLAPGSHLVTIQTARLLPAFFVADLAGGTGTGDPGRIAGVVSACGGPVGRSLVYLPGRSYIVYTGLNGNFRLDRVPAGTYTLLVETPGQPVRIVTGVTVNSGETNDLGPVNVVNHNSNALHCGECNNACPGDQNNLPVCVAGACQPSQACPVGFANCDGNLANACETLIHANPAHCGACGVVCDGPCMGNMCMPTVSTCSNDAFCPSDQFCDLAQRRCVPRTTCLPTEFSCPGTALCVPIGSPCPPPPA